MTQTIKLAQRWVLGSQIGEGGFGRIFEAVGDDGRGAAVKLIPKEPGQTGSYFLKIFPPSVV